MKSLYLNENWDIELDTKSKNILYAEENNAIAQEVANRLKAFKEDMFFYRQEGIDHFNLDISKKPNPSLISHIFESEALKVPSVLFAKCVFISNKEKILTLEMRLELESSEQIVLNLI